MPALTTVEALASVVQTIGLIAAGLWAAWTFQKLQRQRAAEVDIQKGLAETQRALAEAQRAVAEREHVVVETAESHRRLLSQQPNLEVSFAGITEHRGVDPAMAWLAVAVDLHDTGSRNLEIFFDDAVVRAGRFNLQDRNLRRMSEVYLVPASFIAPNGKALETMPDRILRAGQRRRMAFVLPAPEPGLYLVEFQAVYRMLPFETEKRSSKEPVLIRAMEQVVVSVGQEAGRELLDQLPPPSVSVPV